MGQASGEVLEKVVEIAVREVELLNDLGYALALVASSAKDGCDHNVGGDDVGHSVGFDFVGADLEVFFVEEGLEVHALVLSLELIMHEIPQAVKACNIRT